MKLTGKELQLYETMVRIRLFEEKSLEIFEEGLTPGRMHPYVGEEAVAAGVCTALQQTDLVVGTHRSGGHLIAKGADPSKLLAEYIGKESGYSRGKGGPMHFCIPEVGLLCTNGIVGSGITVAAGAALASQYQKKNQVVCCFFGDGASNTGSFHEGLNLSSLWKLPVVYVCENNHFAETMPFDRAFPIEDIGIRASSYGMEGETIDGNDVLAVFHAAQRALSRARGGEGPTLIEAKTYRVGPHFSGESDHYRKDREEELRQWQERDPIDRFRTVLLENGFSRNELDAIDAKSKEEMDRAANGAIKGAFPSADSLLSDVTVENPKGAAS